MWHEARRSERKVHDLMDAVRKRAQRRAVFLAKRRGDPQQSLMVVGSRCRMYRDDGLFQATQDQQGLSQPAQPHVNKGSYSQVGFSYDGDRKEEAHLLDNSDDSDDDDEDDDEDEEEYNSDESNDDAMDRIAKEFGVKRYSWLVFMDKKAKEEEKRQKEVVKGDPAIRKLSRKERRKASQIEREREREASRVTETRVLRHDPYRESRRSPTYEAYSRSRRSRSRSPRSRRYDRDHGVHSDNGLRSKSRAPKIEYITEFGGSADLNDQKLEGISPPPSPSYQADITNRPSSGRILEALHIDPASAVSRDQEKNNKLPKPLPSTSSALAKLSKPIAVGALKPQQAEKKETPQERLKRIMSKQLNKQIKKDTAVEMAKKREQERQRQEKLAEMSRVSRHRYRSHSRSCSRSPSRRYRRSRSRSRSGSPRRSRTPRRHHSRSRSYSHSRSRSPRVRSRSRY